MIRLNSCLFHNLEPFIVKDSGSRLLWSVIIFFIGDQRGVRADLLLVEDQLVGVELVSSVTHESVSVFGP